MPAPVLGTPIVPKKYTLRGVPTVSMVEQVDDLFETLWKNARSVEGSLTRVVANIAAGRVGAAGPEGSIQYNHLNNLTGDSNLTWSATNQALTLSASGILRWGTTASFPSVRRSGVDLDVRLADDSAYTDIEGAQIRANGAINDSGLGFMNTVQSDSFSANFLCRRSRDNAGAVEALQAGDTIAAFVCQGHDGTSYGPTNNGAILFAATENYNTGAKGTAIVFATTTTGSVTRVNRWQIGGTGHLESVNGTELIKWGTTSASPALKKSSAVLQVRVGDDSAFGQLEALDVIVQAANRFGWSGRARLTSPADSQVLLTNDAANDFSRLMFGGTTNSFPALKRSSANLQARLADDSANATFEAANIVLTNSGFYGWSGRSLVFAPADSIVLLTNNAGNAFDRLQFGGTSSSFPALKRSSAALTIRLADDSADADLNMSHVRTSATDFLHVTTAALADGAGAEVGTLTNAPTAGNPTKWVAIDDNGTTRYIPAW